MRLNKPQIIVCWIAFFPIAFLLIAGGIQVKQYYQYRSADGWVWSGFDWRYDELKDDYGKGYRLGGKDRDGKEGRRYYFDKAYNDYSLSQKEYAYARIITTILVATALSIITLENRKHKDKTTEEKQRTDETADGHIPLKVARPSSMPHQRCNS